MSDVREGCRGIAPLTARLEPWQLELCRQPAKLASWLDQHGSPLNVLDVALLGRNAAELLVVASAHGVDLGIYFARKANKALSLVDEASNLGLGVDVASERELRQVLDRGLPAAAIVVTAAVKSRALLELCAASGVTVVIDNEDELHALLAVVAGAPERVPVAFRLSAALPERSASRFGLGGDELLALVDRAWPAAGASLSLAGLHFHLDGYSAQERASALRESIDLIDALRARGQRPSFIDMGGGIPMRYLDDAGEWERFWRAHRDGLLGTGPSLTFEGHGLGLTAHGGEIIGRPNVYPYHQETIRGPFLDEVLAGGIAEALVSRGIQLRCEPGRSLVDGCGMTVARVAFRKQRRDGCWLVGVEMNRTQCRSTSDDFLVDPLLLRLDGEADGEPMEGYLVGAYCIERELLTWRRFRFPRGVRVGDLVVFPNTAGYLMHILESASHQIPLARNVVASDGRAVLDPIDRERASA